MDSTPQIMFNYYIFFHFLNGRFSEELLRQGDSVFQEVRQLASLQGSSGSDENDPSESLADDSSHSGSMNWIEYVMLLSDLDELGHLFADLNLLERRNSVPDPQEKEATSSHQTQDQNDASGTSETQQQHSPENGFLKGNDTSVGSLYFRTTNATTTTETTSMASPIHRKPQSREAFQQWLTESLCELYHDCQWCSLAFLRQQFSDWIHKVRMRRRLQVYVPLFSTLQMNKMKNTSQKQMKAYIVKSLQWRNIRLNKKEQSLLFDSLDGDSSAPNKKPRSLLSILINRLLSQHCSWAYLDSSSSEYLIFDPVGAIPESRKVFSAADGMSDALVKRIRMHVEDVKPSHQNDEESAAGAETDS